ncbi:hypothetical protein K438DRAFT_1981775 [Mycena galopus ATCC 62051]|nr:hypothetical protein K438DRAFT_1981775 [Mycena galopus ATCC 62051]
MYRHGRRLLLLRNGLAETQRVPLTVQTRFKATTPPKPQKADLQSIIPALRELLPVLPKRDDSNTPNAPRRKRRGLLFYLALISPLFIWIEVEKYFDPQPLLEKKRRRVLRERLGRLREGNRTIPPSFPDAKSVVAYLRLLLSTMVHEQTLRNLESEEICDILEKHCPENLLSWLQEFCVASYTLSQQPGDEGAEVKAAEHLQDTCEEVLRKSWLAVHRHFSSASVDP